MFDKYSNILTMILIFFVVAICGIIGYFAYDLFNSNNINSNAQSAIDELDKATQTVKKNKNNIANTTNTTNTVEPLNVVSPLGELQNLTKNQVAAEPVVEEPVTEPGTEPERPEPEKVYMEDYEVMGKIEIPKTGVEYPVLERVTVRSIEMAVAIAYGPGLNEVGNTVIYGHNYRNGLFFSDNKKLSNGDKIYITDKYGDKVTYEIYNIYQTTANDATYFTRDTEGRREISLQTCTDRGDGRIIIWAVEK